jgi:hypothetical protein
MGSKLHMCFQANRPCQLVVSWLASEASILVEAEVHRPQDELLQLAPPRKQQLVALIAEKPQKAVASAFVAY